MSHKPLCRPPKPPSHLSRWFFFYGTGEENHKAVMGRKEGNPPILSEREFRRENLCAAFLFVFKCVCVYIYIFESIREDQLFQGSSVCTSGARAAAVWIKQAGSFPVLHTATTAASNRVLWQVYNWSFVTLSCRWVVQLHWIQARLWPCIHERWVEAYLLNISVLNATLL